MAAFITKATVAKWDDAKRVNFAEHVAAKVASAPLSRPPRESQLLPRFERERLRSRLPGLPRQACPPADTCLRGACACATLLARSCMSVGQSALETSEGAAQSGGLPPRLKAPGRRRRRRTRMRLCAASDLVG